MSSEDIAVQVLAERLHALFGGAGTGAPPGTPPVITDQQKDFVLKLTSRLTMLSEQNQALLREKDGVQQERDQARAECEELRKKLADMEPGRQAKQAAKQQQQQQQPSRQKKEQRANSTASRGQQGSGSSAPSQQPAPPPPPPPATPAASSAQAPEEGESGSKGDGLPTRDQVVGMMRAAAMGKDTAKLEEAIALAQGAGLGFEAQQGQRMLNRLKG